MNVTRTVLRPWSGLPRCANSCESEAAVVVAQGKHAVRVCISCAVRIDREKKAGKL